MLTVLVRKWKEGSEFEGMGGETEVARAPMHGAAVFGGCHHVGFVASSWFDHQGRGRKGRWQRQQDQGEEAARAISWQTALSFAL